MRKALTPTTVSRNSRRIGIVRHGSQMLTVWNCNSDVYVRVTASSELDMTGPSLRAQMSVKHDDNARDCTVEWLYTVISVKHNYYNISLSNVCGGSDLQVRANVSDSGTPSRGRRPWNGGQRPALQRGHNALGSYDKLKTVVGQ